ncbi:MAG: PAS domain S-box protein [Desulfosalsimonadaceae bacterium]|nr:PAS domain S-box protein [Desulfosalsimonadaceae bacterium]
MKTFSLRKRLLIPMMLSLVILLGSLIFLAYRFQQNEILDDVNKRFDSVQSSFYARLNDEAIQISSALTTLLYNPQVKADFINHDRGALLKTNAPLFASLKNYGITHLYFTGPDRVNFLRVHQPDRYGDTINRITTMNAEKTNRLSKGLELGPLGTLTMRVVVPWYDGDRLIGYVEMGKEIDHIIRKIKEIHGVDIYVLIEKEYLDKEGWESGMRMLKRDNDWNRFPTNVLMDSTTKIVPKGLGYFFDEAHHVSGATSVPISISGRQYQVKFLHITDAAGKGVGDVVVMMDVSRLIEGFRLSTYYVSFICILIFGGLCFFFYIYLGQTDRQLTLIQNQILDLERDRSKFILANMPAHISLLDKNGRFIQWNLHSENLFGYNEIEAVHKIGLRDVAANPEEADALSAIAIDNGFAEMEIQGRRKNGGLFWMKCRLVKMLEKDGSDWLLSIAEDITERRESEIKLGESESRYRGLVETSADAIISVMLDKKIFQWNKAAETIFGYSQDEAIGQPIDMLVPEKYQDKHVHGFDAFLAHGHSNFIGRTVELEARRKDGTEFPMELSLSALKKDDAWFFNGIIRDISRRKADEEEKARLQAQLIQAQKLESLGTIAGGIAHDFNNLLSVIIGYAELARSIIDNDDAKTSIDEVLKAGFRARDIVKQILSFSRKQPQERKPVWLSSIVKEVLTQICATFPSTIDIRLQIQNESGKIEADTSQIHRVVMNLLVNARDAMQGAGGELEVSITPKQVDPAEAATYAENFLPGKYIQLTVRDTGNGMDAATIERIFEPYFTTKAPEHGTGLGLSVVYGIVKSHGGTITVTSELNIGTTFTILLPVIDRLVSETTAPQKTILAGKERILFVDDEKAIANLGKAILEKIGYHVEALNDPAEALELFRKHPHQYDLIITDLTMPKITGDVLCQHISAIRPGMPIIVCSGLSEQISAEKAALLGIKAYIIKPITIHELSYTIHNIFN